MINIPYGRQYIDDDDILAVEAALRSDFLTTGPLVETFERGVADFCGATHGVAVSSGTAALHGAMHALGIGPGDEVIVPPMTFVATANCVAYLGGTPVFADVCSGTLLIDPDSVRSKVTQKTKAIIGVDYAGQPCDWDSLGEIAREHGLALVADSCHAIGATRGNRSVGTMADMTVLSFHPVKHVATGEGGMVLTDSVVFAERIQQFRNHGITADAAQREAKGMWFYEMEDLGYNYRLTAIQCALGSSQLKKLDGFLKRRRELANVYDEAFAGTKVVPLSVAPHVEHAYHLYVVKVPQREHVFHALRDMGIGIQVHYIPAHLHPYYRQRYGTGEGLCPVAERAYESILSLPMFPAMRNEEQEQVVEAILSVVG